MDRPGALEVDHRGGTPLMPRASHHHRTHLVAHQVGFSVRTQLERFKNITKERTYKEWEKTKK